VANSTFQDLPAWLALSRAELPPRLAIELLEHFQSPAAIFSASPLEIASAANLSPAMLSRLLSQRPEEVGSRDCAALQTLGASIITLRDADYPPLLRHIHDPPPLLYLRGQLTPQDQQAIAIVGSRRCSPYGRLVAHSLARDLALRGITIISGLAVGIDGSAHQGALEAGGRSIGVMACGLDVPYPHEHGELKEKILRQGVLLSEVPLGTPPKPERFPVRNRLISGLALGVVVVEAPERSGALITAHLAAEQGREVFAVPGSANSVYSRGCHNLIREGAKLIDNVEDILEELRLPLSAPAKPEFVEFVGQELTPATKPPAPQAKTPPMPSTLQPEESRLLSCLSLQQKYVDEIIRETALPSSQVSAGLMMLELKGLVRRLPGNLFVRVK